MCCIRGQRKAQKSLGYGVSGLKRVVGQQNDPREADIAGYEEMDGVDHDEDTLESRMRATEEEWRKPRVPSESQNWCDLFFILYAARSAFLFILHLGCPFLPIYIS